MWTGSRQLTESLRRSMFIHASSPRFLSNHVRERTFSARQQLRLLSAWLLQSNTCSSAIFIDEFDASVLERAPK
jgi:hypothetical protein